MALSYRIAVILAACLVAGTVLGQEYRIGPGDVLEIRFWQDPNLNANVKVGQDGMVTLDVIGKIKASEKTAAELQNEIVRQMSRLNTRISQATVRVIDYQYQHVFLKGQVLAPGKRSFEVIPDLWTIINESGGITEFGDLSRVTIIRGGEEAGKVEVVNVLDAIEKKELDRLPKIRRQDTIEIPRNMAGLPSPDLAQDAAKRSVIYVIGAVNGPGPIQYEDNIDVMEALALAGGPSPDANLKKARIITKDGFYSQTIEINLEHYSKTGTPARYVLRKEDTFLLPRRSDGIFGIGIGTAAAALGVITSAIIIYDRLSSDETTGSTVR